MNLSVKKFYFILSSVLLLLNCKKDINNIGLPSKPQDSIGVFFTDSTTIDSWNILNDSVLTSHNNALVVGKESNAIFGKFSASSYVRILPNTFPIIDTSQISRVDSIVLVLRAENDTVSLKSIVQPISVYKLPREIKHSKHYSFENYEGMPLDESLKLADGVFEGNKSYNYKAYLNKDLGKLLIANAKDTNLLSSYFPGIALIPGGETSPYSSILTFSTSGGNYLKIYFNDILGSSKEFIFSFGDGTKGKKHINISWEKPELFSSLTRTTPINTTLTDNICFAQSGTGLNTKVSFPYINQLFKGRNVIITQARLFIYTLPSLDVIQDNPPLSLYQTNINNQSPKLLNSNRNDFNKDGQFYSFDVTSYIQGQINSRMPGDGLIIAPRTSINNSTDKGGYQKDNQSSIRKTRFYNQNIGKINPLLKDKRMKLLLNYTEVH